MSKVHRAPVVALLCACLIQSPAWADDAPPDDAVTNDEAAAEAEELSAKIEIVVNGGLRSDRVTEHGVSVSLRNISDEEIAGPIGVTIVGTGIDELQLVLPEVDGVAKNYFEVVRDTAVLRPNQTSRPVRMEFRSMNALSFLDRNKFALDANVVRPEDVEAEEEIATAVDAELVPGKDYSWEEMYEAFAVQDKWTPYLLEQDGVIATGTSEDDAGNLVIRVYTMRHGVIQDLPGSLDGMDLQQAVIGDRFRIGPAHSTIIRPGGGQAVSGETRNRRNHGLGRHLVDVIPPAGNHPPTIGGPAPLDPVAPLPPAESPAQPGNAPGTSPAGPIPPESIPYAGPPGDPTIRFARPVPIGVSTLNMVDDCSAGTIGCRCVDSAGNFYGLSNNHVWAGQNNNDPTLTQVATIGDLIVQPGLIDNACVVNPLDAIGTLADYVRYDLFDINVMDTALISTTPALLQAETPDDGYGTPTSNPIQSPFIGLQVQKYGRTTLYTRGRVIGLNVTGPIVATVGTVNYVGMIEIQNDVSLFGGPGDSGSLIVSFPDRRPVALLFAGGGGQTLANPITPVLERFGVIVDDGSGTPAPPIVPVSGRMGNAVGPVVPEFPTLPPALAP